MAKINHPNYYHKPDRMECIEEMRHNYGDYLVAGFCYLNAYKYLYRAGGKEGNDRGDDLAKAKWYVKYIEENLYYAISPFLDEGDNFFELGKDVNMLLREALKHGSET